MRFFIPLLLCDLGLLERFSSANIIFIGVLLRMKFNKFFLTCLTAGLAFTGLSASQAKVDVNTARGAITLEQPASSNVAVFDMAVMDTMDALGVTPKGIPSNLLVDYLKDVKQKDSVEVGTLFEPDLEALNRLKPELIVIGGRMAPNYDVLTKLAPVVDFTNTGVSVENSQSLLTELGKLFDKEEEAAKLQENLTAELEKTKEIVKDQGKALMIMVNGTKISSHGAQSRFGYLFNDFGWEAADDSDSTARHGQPVSFEFIRKLDPDWILVMDRSSAIQAKGENARAVLDNALLKDSKAFKNDRIIYLDNSSYLASGGYQQMMIELKLLQDTVQKVGQK